MSRRVIVLSGGDSPEREVSIRSGQAVAEALQAAGFTVANFDPENGLDFLERLTDDDIVFPILHGAGGEDGMIQSALENRNLQYLGTDSQASHLCFDKELTRKCLEENGLPVARGAAINRAEYDSHPLSKNPHILKVARGGSSIGTLFVRDPTSVNESEIDEIFDLDDLAIIEELVEGVEITVPILAGRALPVIEIKPPADGEFDYENKYNGQTAELCPPENVAEETQHQAQKIAEKVHAITGARHLSRVDLIIRPDETMVVLEINTMPGMTEQSLYPKSAAVAGIEMPDLVTQFVKMVETRGES